MIFFLLLNSEAVPLRSQGAGGGRVQCSEHLLLLFINEGDGLGDGIG